MKNKTRGKSEGTETKGETKREKRTRIPGARARGREWERKTRHEKAVVATEEKKRSGKRGFLPTNRGFPLQSFLFVLQSSKTYKRGGNVRTAVTFHENIFLLTWNHDETAIFHPIDTHAALI